MSKVEEFVHRLVDEYEPEKVILFGSYAYGEVTDDSDVDLLVVMPQERSDARKSVEIRSKLRPGFPLDLLVRSAEHVAQRVAWNDFFMRDVVEKGKVLYDAAHS